MKRSTLLAELEVFLALDLVKGNYSEQILKFLEDRGMSPPPIPVRKNRPINTRWGGGCNMRCNCQDCNPNFIVHEWEEEPK